VNKTAASAAQLAKCMLLHASACTTVAPSSMRTNKNFILLTLIFYKNNFIRTGGSFLLKI